MADKTLITGGAGFIGSHLADRLKAEGRQLLILDDLSTGQRRNIQALLDGDCTLVEGTAAAAMRDPTLWAGVKEVYHLAATVGVKRTVENPLAMVRNNIDETRAVLEAASRAGASVLVASSSEVYGTCPTLPLREQMDLVYGPTTASRWTYGMSKALGEHLAIDLARRRGLRFVIVRLFNTIGPRQVGRYGMVVPRFVASAVAEEALEIYGNGTQSRAFCDVRDATDAMVRLLGRPDCHGQIFNLGSDREVTIIELADRVIRLSGSHGGKRWVPYEAVYGEGFEDPPRRFPDLSKIRTAIGFEPRIELDETLTELIQIERRAARAVPAGSGKT